MKEIGPFKLYNKVPNDIHYGTIYVMEVNLPILYSSKRTIRVYLPEDFDKSKKYKLLIMADGQNIVDKYTSAFGAWQIDIHEHNLLNEDYDSFIVVGIDSPKDYVHRALEYSFPFLKINNEEEGKDVNKTNLELESHLLYKYISEDLLPLIRKYFPISDNYLDIGVGGASMGGVFALSLINEYPELFGFSLIFSPGFFLYNEKETKEYLSKSLTKLKNHKLYFYSGNVGFEEKFPERTVSTFNFYKENGFNDSEIKLVIDPNGEHNEATWSKHFEDSIKYWCK